eukprot:1524712-Rhodomonas_salina.1
MKGNQNQQVEEERKQEPPPLKTKLKYRASDAWELTDSARPSSASASCSGHQQRQSCLRTWRSPLHKHRSSASINASTAFVNGSNARSGAAINGRRPAAPPRAPRPSSPSCPSVHGRYTLCASPSHATDEAGSS